MEKVTRDILRSMQMGETRTFDLPDRMAYNAGQATAYQMARIEGCKYSAVEGEKENQLVITKNPS